MSLPKYDQLIESTSQIWSDALLENENLLSELDLLDADLKEMLREVGRLTFQKTANRLAEEVTQQSKEPGLWVKKSPVVTYYTIFGPIEVRSPYLYNDKNGKSKNPTRHALGIEGKQRSLTLERAMTDFGAEHSFESASMRFSEHYGWKVPKSVVRLVTYKRAEQMESWFDENIKKGAQLYNQELDKSLKVEELLVELDGCTIRTCELFDSGTSERTKGRNLPKKERHIEYKEVRVGLCRRLDEKRKKYVAKRDSYENIVGQMFNLSAITGMREGTQVVGISDGGNGLAEELQAQYLGMQFILDKPHFESHLYETAEELGYSGEKREKWVRKIVDKSWNGEIEEVLEELENEYENNSCERLKKLRGYIERFKENVHYGEYKEKGWPIGSGEIESSHKYVVQQRLKITGASWLEEHLNPMLAMRAVRANEWWENFWIHTAQETMKHREINFPH